MSSPLNQGEVITQYKPRLYQHYLEKNFTETTKLLFLGIRVSATLNDEIRPRGSCESRTARTDWVERIVEVGWVDAARKKILAPRALTERSTEPGWLQCAPVIRYLVGWLRP